MDKYQLLDKANAGEILNEWPDGIEGETLGESIRFRTTDGQIGYLRYHGSARYSLSVADKTIAHEWAGADPNEERS